MFRYPALFAFVLALVIRLSYSIYIQQLHPESIYQFDSWGYLRLAYNLFYEQIFSQMAEPPLTPDSTRTPLYPAFIALFHLLKINGEWIVYTQALIGAATAFITVKAAEIISRFRSSNVLAGILVACDLPSIFMGNVVATESLFTLLLVTAIYFVIRGIKFREESDVHLSILFLALATLCRPISLWFTLLVPLLYLVGSELSFSGRIKAFFVQYFIIGLLIGPWIWRNQQTFNQPFFVSISEVNMLFHTSTQVRSIAENRDQKEIEMEYRQENLGHLDFKKDAQAIKPFIEFSRAETQRVIQQYPTTFFKMWGNSILMFFLKPMRSYFNMQLKGNTSYSAIASVQERQKNNLVKRTLESTDNVTLLLVGFQWALLVVIYLGIVVSLGRWIKNHFRVFFLLSSLVIYLALISSLTEVDARFRIPAVPILTLLCLPAYELWFNRITGKHE